MSIRKPDELNNIKLITKYYQESYKNYFTFILMFKCNLTTTTTTTTTPIETDRYILLVIFIVSREKTHLSEAIYTSHVIFIY